MGHAHGPQESGAAGARSWRVMSCTGMATTHDVVGALRILGSEGGVEIPGKVVTLFFLGWLLGSETRNGTVLMKCQWRGSGLILPRPSHHGQGSNLRTVVGCKHLFWILKRWVESGVGVFPLSFFLCYVSHQMEYHIYSTFYGPPHH